MKILNVLHLPWFAGTEQMFVNYTNGFLNLGHEVVCVVPKDAEVIKHLIKHKNLSVVEDDAVRLTRGGWFNIVSILKYRRLIKSQKIHVVFCHSGGAVKFFKKAAWSLAKVIGVCHGANVNNIIKADIAIAMNEAMRIDMMSHGISESKIYKIPNYIDIPKETLPDTMPHQEIRIGVMCRLERSKNVDELINAFYLLIQKGIKARLVIAGTGVERKNLESLVHQLSLDGCVDFVGWVSDKKRFFLDIDVFCLPSSKETFGLVLLEAMHYRRIVVCVKADGPNEIVRDGFSGFIAECNDTKNLSQKLLYAINLSDEDKAAMIESAYQNLELKYSTGVFRENISILLESLC